MHGRLIGDCNVVFAFAPGLTSLDFVAPFCLCVYFHSSLAMAAVTFPSKSHILDLL